MTFNHDIFFEKFRPWYKKKRGTKTFSASAANAVEFLLSEFEKYTQWKNTKEIAYAFATIAHETAWTFKPIKEYRARAGTKGRANQDRYWLTGYYGRGYVQLTWKANYQKATKELDVNLVANPDLALDPDIAFQILTYGMHGGWFTGKKLSHFISATKADYRNARTIINRLDKADLIAGYARDIEAMLNAAANDAPSLIRHTADSEPSTDDTPVDEGQGGVFDEEGNAVESPDSLAPEEFPQDDNPDEVKAGEAAPDETAQEGEAIVGGRPQDPPVEVEAVEPEKTSGWGAWAANVKAQIAALGIGLPSLGGLAFFENPKFWYIAGALVGFAAIVSITVYLTSMVLKHRERIAREETARVQTLKKMEIASDPTKYNVEVVKTPAMAKKPTGFLQIRS